MRTLETRLKMSKAHTGKPHPHKGHKGNRNQVQVISKATKLKISTKLSGRKLSEEHKRNISKAKKGHKGLIGAANPAWKGGVKPFHKRIWSHAAYQEWRRKVFERDGYKCLTCNSVGGELNAHHIIMQKDRPDLRFDIDNGATLCAKCHQILHSNKGVTLIA